MTGGGTDIVAIDWSGRVTGAERTIWLAHVRDGLLVDLADGRGRASVVEEAIARTRERPRTVVGLDFSFSFPRWFCEREGWTSGRDVWEAMREHGEELLAACEPPLWGRPGRRAQTLGPPLRATEVAAGAKSTFQVGGAGAVGTGAIRGMPHLLRLAEAGLAIWPFDPPAFPLAVEMYPRALTGPVVKRRPEDREVYLARNLPELRGPLRDRAAGSEDAFDAAVSALVIARHAPELAALPAYGPASIQAVEGEIWLPASGASRSGRRATQSRHAPSA